MPAESESKVALDAIIRKSRVHLYKPIQIAEILYHHRTGEKVDLSDPESYRNISKRWRDTISSRLVGRVSTSSQKYQDNIFDPNAMPPELLVELDKINRTSKGIVEAYIYRALEKRLLSVYVVRKFIKHSTPETFVLREAIGFFEKSPGLKRSVDKMYEILVYALFSTIVRALKAQVTIEVINKDKEILKDFEVFLRTVLGIDAANPKLCLQAALYRVGVTNAADRGLDMWSNFGVAFQVKHLSLTEKLVEEIADNIPADRIVIVCIDSEKEAIESLLKQVGWGTRIKGILTFKDLASWYELCIGIKYQDKLGKQLLDDVEREFDAEFPSSTELGPFMAERGYDKVKLPAEWLID